MDWHGFCGASYTSRSLVADAEQLINWYPEQIEQPAVGTTAQALYPTPGCAGFYGFSATNIGTRGLYAIDANRVIGVIGDMLIGLDGALMIGKFYGTVAKDTNLVPITSNGVIGNQAFLASGTNGYTLNLTTAALTQTLTNKAKFVGMLDGFFISFDGGTGRIYLSNLNDGLTWDPTQFAQRSTAPDSWKAMIVVPPDIWLIGSVSGDIWFNAGAFPFPLAPRQGLNFKYGIAAPYSLAAIGPTVLWLAQAVEGTGIVVRTVGYEPQRVSTYAIEHAIADYARLGSLSNVEAMVYEDRGHPFYCLRFPTPERTWVYDLTMNTWHERGYWNPARNQFEVWRPRVHCFAFSQHIVGDDQSGSLETMDTNLGTEADGTPIRRVRRTPAVFSQFRQLPIRVVEILLESGLGLQSGQGSDPIAMWRTSDDGGRTWGNERQGRSGRVGQYRTRLRFWRNGIPRDRVAELSVSDPIPWRILSCFINNDVAQ
jgi:hypothetical protein